MTESDSKSFKKNVVDLSKIKSKKSDFISINASKHKYDSLVANNLSSSRQVGYRFCGVSCKGLKGCNRIFADKNGGDNTFKPTIKCTMYFCSNSSEQCTYSLCMKCYTTLLIELNLTSYYFTV